MKTLLADTWALMAQTQFAHWNVQAPGGLQAGKYSAVDFVEHLIEGHESLTSDALIVHDAAGEAGDLETQDLVIGRLQEHQKTLWMLRSYLGKS